MELAVQHLDQQLGKDGSHSTRATYEHVRPQHHHRAHGVGRKRFPDAGRVAADEIELQLSSLVRRDAHVGEFPETGIDAVYRLTARGSGFDSLAGFRYGGERLWIGANRSIVAG